MNDNEARKIILQIFYDKRADGFISINEKNFGRQISIPEVYRFCTQLDELKLIQFKSQWADNKIFSGWGKITVIGSDLIETELSATATNYQHDLNETQLHVLRLIRTSPSRVSINKISEILLYSKDEVTSAIKILQDKKFIRQDNRDNVDWNHEQATYFTVPTKRNQIQNLLQITDSASTRALRVFLCHSKNDKQEVRNLYRRLIADKIDPWLDEERLLPGQEWQQEIPKAVRESDVVIVCLSCGSVNKEGYIQKEIRYALDVADEKPENAIFLIPLKLEECEVPQRLSRWQWVNYFDENGHNKLLKALRLCTKNLV